MTSSALRIAPFGGLALAAVIATGITGAVAPMAENVGALAQRLQSGKVTQQVAQRVEAAKTRALDMPVFRKNTTQPAEQQVFLTPQQREKIAKNASYYDQLRAKMRWIDVRMGESRLKTPDELSRIVLAQSAANRAALHEVGLNFRDVYGIIYSETSWIPRMGASKDGTPNLGIAQFEPATAKALGLRDPHDPVEAVHVAALHLKEAAVWSSKKIQGLKLSPEVQAAKLREGISIYYNLSTKGRAQWNGMNTAKLPIETQRHISNARRGAQEAATIEAKLREFRLQERMTADNGRGGNGNFIRTGS